MRPEPTPPAKKRQRWKVYALALLGFWWVITLFTHKSTPTAALAPARLTHPVHIAGDGINVRRAAMAEALSVGTVSSTDSVDYIGRYNDQWSEVRLRDGTSGYISNKFLDGVAYTPPAKSTIATTASASNYFAARKATAASKVITHKALAHKAKYAPRPVALAYYCASGNTVKYHSSPGCRGLNRCSASVENMPLSEAEASMDPCKFCH